MTEYKRYGWWSDHDFERRSIKHNFLTFCGWDVLETTVDSIDLLTGNLVCALFETGGRASEVLELRPEQFDLRDNHVLVLRMPILKHREKIDGVWRRKKMDRTFPISLEDSLLAPLMEHIETVNKGEKIFPFSYAKLYKLIRDIDKPKGAKHGPWWPHRFRGERATQLVMEKGLGVIQLMEWFGWARTDTPTFYAKLSPEAMIKMIVG